MTEFVKVIQEYNRLCKNNNCDNCPLFDYAHSCSDLFYNEPEKVEEIVMKWSRENPVPIYPTIGEVVSKICMLMNIDTRTNLNTIYDERLTKEAADYFGIAPINENTLKPKT